MISAAASLHPQRRRALRRAVSLEAEVTSQLWEGSVVMTVSDLTQHGLWLESHLPLSAADEVHLSMPAPRATGHIIEADARVVRVSLAPRCDVCRVGPGMGVVFTEIAVWAQLELARELRGFPPPLRRARVCSCGEETSGVYVRATLERSPRALGLMTRILDAERYAWASSSRSSSCR
jgi:hypothetical protein